MKIVFCKTSFAGPISGADEIAVMYAIELKAAGHATSMLLIHPPAAADPLAARLREAKVLDDACFTGFHGLTRRRTQTRNPRDAHVFSGQ